MNERRKPGAVRDAILALFMREKRELAISEITGALEKALDGPVAPSSIRSYLNLNTPGQFIRTGHGKYRLVRR